MFAEQRVTEDTHPYIQNSTEYNVCLQFHRTYNANPL